MEVSQVPQLKLRVWIYVVYYKDNQLIVSIVPCYCMSYSDSGDGVVVGACPFLCGNYSNWYMDIDADTNLTTLCDRDIDQNRIGQLCGQCKDNHSPSPYSYQLKLRCLLCNCVWNNFYPSNNIDSYRQTIDYRNHIYVSSSIIHGQTL